MSLRIFRITKSDEFGSIIEPDVIEHDDIEWMVDYPDGAGCELTLRSGEVVCTSLTKADIQKAAEADS